MLVSTKSKTRKTHRLSVFINEQENIKEIHAVCGSILSDKSIREIDSIDELKDEALCGICYWK